MILHRYFARRFFWSFALVMAVFAVLLFLLDLVDKMQDFPTLPLREVVTLVMLNAPSEYYEIIPLVIVLATVALYVRLARSSELVVVRAAGRSALYALAAPLIVALLIGVISITMLNPVVAATSKRYNDLRNIHAGSGTSVMAIAAEGLWFRQGDAGGQTVIHAERASSDLTVLFDTTFLKFDASGQPVERIYATAARLSQGAWVLHETKTWSLGTDSNPEAGARQSDTRRIASTLTRDRIIDSFGKPEYIPLWDLPAFIAQLERAGFSANRYMMWFQMELARPLFLVALVMISAAFTMRHARLANTGLSVLTAVMLGFGLHYIRNFAQILGENGEIPLLLAAWAPPVASSMLAIGILLHMEDG
ncbi:LPS export ABC transporter permease LptG [Roseovarius salis]|uniref:LPS export ABC transporter permease LptG n=1 Tax=Roseovarius salis TaxID=3376063 RepID=UPI0037C688E2